MSDTLTRGQIGIIVARLRQACPESVVGQQCIQLLLDHDAAQRARIVQLETQRDEWAVQAGDEVERLQAELRQLRQTGGRR